MTWFTACLTGKEVIAGRALSDPVLIKRQGGAYLPGDRFRTLTISAVFNQLQNQDIVISCPQPHRICFYRLAGGEGLKKTYFEAPVALFADLPTVRAPDCSLPQAMANLMGNSLSADGGWVISCGTKV